MATKAETARILARARCLIGVRFRPHGRSPETGLDCIGLVASAAEVADPPSGYALRGGSVERLQTEMRAHGFRLHRNMVPGDVLAMRAGAAQLHLGIWTGTSLIHADAGLRRVVERPDLPPWPVLEIWRKRSRRK